MWFGGGHRQRLSRALALIALCMCASGLAAQTPGPPHPLGHPPPPVQQQALPQAMPAKPAQPGQNADDYGNTKAQIFEGSGEFVKPPASDAPKDMAQPGDITLDFADADVRDVVRSVFGETLKVPYVLDPQVAGHITLKTGMAIREDAVVPALEAALKTVGAAIVVTNGIYNVVPIAAAQKQTAQIAASSDHAGMPGYGIEVLPLKFIAAAEMQKILEPLVPAGAILKVDGQRNLIFLAGTEPERASIRDTIALFDVDYLAGMSFALVQPQHVDVGTLATELGKIFDETSSPIAGMVRLIPISRINTMLVVTPRSTYLREVSRWVSRLDVIPITPGRQLHYYKLQNARAADVAQTLSEVFGTGAMAQPHAAAPGAPQPTGAQAPAQLSAAPQPVAAAPQPQPFAQAAAETPRAQAAGVAGDGPQIVTDDINNALIVRADAAEYDAIEKIVRQMDVTPDQVLIEATVVEVTLNDTLQYGVEWAFRGGSQTFAQGQTGTPAASFPGFGFTYNVPNVSVAMSALGTLSKINVVSSPKLLTLDNMPATIEVGDQIPIVTQTAQSTNGDAPPLVSTVQQLSTGVILSVTPRIGNSGMVYLTVAQEVSEAVKTTTSGIDSPTVEERKLQTTVAIADGSTVALGGMIRRSDASGNSGIPYLKDIPVVGGLFGPQNDTRERTELLVFLTPRVIRSPPAAVAATADLRQALDGARETLEHFERHKKDIPRLPWR